MQCKKFCFGKGTIIDGSASLYRMMALFGSVAFICQCIVWSILCIISLIYYGIGAPHNGKNEHLLSAYGYIFTTTYYRSPDLIKITPPSLTNDKPVGDVLIGIMNELANATTIESCANISPHTLFGLTLLYLLLTLHLLVTSILLFLVVYAWRDAQTIRDRVIHWIIAAFVMSAWEFVTGMIFFVEFLVCSDREQHNVAAAAITLSVLFFKGFVMFCLNLALSSSLFCIQFCGYSECPV